MTVQEGADRARQELVDLFPNLQDADVRLEEAEVPPAGPRWSFTFSAVLPKRDGNDESDRVEWLLRPLRQTKAVEINSDTGELIAIRNRSI